MNIKTSKDGFEFSSLVKMVSIGYAISVTILFFLIIFDLALTKSAELPVYKVLPALFIVPIVALLQELLLGFLIAFGLFIYKKWRSIEVVNN